MIRTMVLVLGIEREFPGPPMEGPGGSLSVEHVFDVFSL